MKTFILIILAFAFKIPSLDGPRDLGRRAYENYLDGKFDDAEVNNKKAIAKREGFFEAIYNLGNSLYRQERYEEAIQQYNLLINNKSSPEPLRSKAFYNLGNANIKLNKIEKGIESYKQALRLNPSDKLAKYNLAYAKKLSLLNLPKTSPSETSSKDNQKKQEPTEEKENIDKDNKEFSKQEGLFQTKIEELTLEEMEQILKSVSENEKRIINNKVLKYDTVSHRNIEMYW